MDIYVRTRGTSLDYRFLGEAPAHFWWREYRDWTDTEGPTILLESDKAAWRIYIAGISSARRDLSERPIQFNLALAGQHATADAQAGGLAHRVLARSLAGLAAQRGKTIPGTELDERLPADVVEQLLADSGEAAWSEAATAVRAAYGDGPEPAPAEAGADEPGAPAAWTGGLLDQAARDQFLALAAELLGGQTGRALVLNLLASASDSAEFAAAAAQPGRLGILAARHGADLDEGVTNLAAKKALAQVDLQSEQNPGRKIAEHGKRQPRPMRLKTALPIGLALLLVLAIGATLAIMALTFSPTTTHPTRTIRPTHSVTPRPTPTPTPTPTHSSSPKPSPSHHKKKHHHHKKKHHHRPTPSPTTTT